MQVTIDFAKLLSEGWITPKQVGKLYNGALDTLHAQTAVFQMMGDASLLFGFAALLSLPLAWVSWHWINKG